MHVIAKDMKAYTNHSKALLSCTNAIHLISNEENTCVYEQTYMHAGQSIGSLCKCHLCGMACKQFHLAGDSTFLVNDLKFNLFSGNA